MVEYCRHFGVLAAVLVRQAFALCASHIATEFHQSIVHLATFITRDVNDARSGRGPGRGQEHKAEAKAEAEANSHDAEAKIALIFSANFFHFDSIFSKNEIFGRFSTVLQKCRLKTDFNVRTLLVNTPKNDQLRLWTQATASPSTH